MNVMVAGGAGYIGSHAVKMLFEAGHRVVAVDNLLSRPPSGGPSQGRLSPGRFGRDPATGRPCSPATRSSA